MATRSGKRINRSFQEIETKVETEFNPKSERKTRRRVKENNDVSNDTCTKLRKRSNYVRYPSIEANEDGTEIVTEKEIKSARKLARNTLRERDVNVTLNALEEDNTTKVQRKSSRLARRTKKLDDTVQPMDIDHDTPEDVKKKPRKKKNKAKVEELEEPIETVEAADVVVIAKKKSKKTKKKGKKNSSVNEIESVQNLSVHNTSVDSFHSADGSPLEENNFNDEANPMSLDYQVESLEYPKSDCVEIGNFENSNNTLNYNKENNPTLKKKTSVRNSSTTILPNGDMDSNGEILSSIKRKSSIHNSKFDKNSLSSVSKLPLEKSLLNITSDTSYDKKTPKQKSSIKNSTFDKVVMSPEVNCSIQNTTFDNNTPLKRRSSIKSSTFDRIDLCASSTESLNSTSEKINCNITYEKNDVTKRISIDKSNISISSNDKKNSTFDKIDLSASSNNIKNSTFDKIDLSASSNNIKNSTFDKTESDLNSSVSDGINIILYASDYDKLKLTTNKLNTPPASSSNIKNSTFEKIDLSASSTNVKNSTFDKTESDLNSSVSDGINIILYPSDYARLNLTTNKLNTPPTQTQILNSTPDKSAKDCVNESESQSEHVKDEVKNKSHDLTCDKNSSLNSTYEKIESKNATENIFHSSDSSNVKVDIYLDKSGEAITLSTTSDESKTENILNTTPLLVESSMEDNSITTDTLNMEKTPDCLSDANTKMKRESTFTKDTPEVSKVSEPHTPLEETPSNSLTVPSPGYTPFHSNHKSSHKKRTVLNVTHSLEKPSRKSSFEDVEPKTTKVMFCSPVDITEVTNERKTKVVKSSMKGSNKSFVFDDSMAMSPMERAGAGAGAGARARVGRKRSYTHGDAQEARAKRSRLGGDLQLSVDRLSRPRGSSTTAKQPEPATPPRWVARPQCRSEGNAGVVLGAEGAVPGAAGAVAGAAGAVPGAAGARTRLPNFAALHQRRFERMESLDEFKRRRERRARRLLTPTGGRPAPERSPTETVESKPSTSKKIDTPVSTRKLPTLESLRPGYTRFGFKIDVAGNPFGDAERVGVTAKEIKASRQPAGRGALAGRLVLPSLAGGTAAAARRAAARSAAMKEVPRAAAAGPRDARRHEYRTIIKGVRTNRRFELQMKSRNVEG